MNFSNEANEAIKRVEKIIQQWEDNWLDSRETLELIVPDLEKIICYVERLRNEFAELKKRQRKQET